MVKVKALAVAAAVAAVLAVSVVTAAPGDLVRTNNTGGSAVGVPQIPGTPCWRLGSQTFRPEGTPFSACTTTTTTTTTVAPTTTLAATTTTSVVATTTTTVPPGGVFTETFDDLDGWVFAHRRYEQPANSDAPSTATLANGQAQIVAFDQNYGDATLRSVVPYDLTGGGTVSLDISDNAEGYPLLGAAYVFFSAQPWDAAAQMAGERAEPYDAAAMPTEGVAVRLLDNCRVPWAPPVLVSYSTTAPNGRTVQQGSCSASPDGRLRLVYTPGTLSIRNGADQVIVSYSNVTIPPVGYLTLGVHNHASTKYSDGPGPMPAVIGLFDNVTYPVAVGSGPAAPLPTTTTTLAATTTTSVVATTTPPAAGGFVETFDTAASLDRFDYYVANGRDMGSTPPTAWHGDHSSGAPCGNALTGRTVNWPDHPWGADGIQRLTDPGELVYWCAPGGPATGHMMTSFQTNGYGHVDFTPRQSFNNVTRICWDVNATNLGGRKWVQVAVVPEAIFQANNRRLDYIHPGFRPGPGDWGLGVQGVALVTTTQGSVTGFGTLAGDHYAIHLGNADKVTRYQNCLYQNGTVTQAFPGGVRTVDLAGSLPTGPVRVIFQDASYHPDKAAGESPATVANGLSWHWDNLIIEAG